MSLVGPKIVLVQTLQVFLTVRLAVTQAYSHIVINKTIAASLIIDVFFFIHFHRFPQSLILTTNWFLSVVLSGLSGSFITRPIHNIVLDLLPPRLPTIRRCHGIIFHRVLAHVHRGFYSPAPPCIQLELPAYYRRFCFVLLLYLTSTFHAHIISNVNFDLSDLVIMDSPVYLFVARLFIHWQPARERTGGRRRKRVFTRGRGRASAGQRPVSARDNRTSGTGGRSAGEWNNNKNYTKSNRVAGTFYAANGAGPGRKTTRSHEDIAILHYTGGYR